MKILLIQLRRIGDIIMTTPAVRLLRQSFPQATIDYLTEPMGKAILDGNPHLDEVLIYDRKHGLRQILEARKRRYDAVVDFMGNPRTALLTGLSRAEKKVGFRHSGRTLYYNLRVPIPKEPEYVASRKMKLAEALMAAAEGAHPESPSPVPEVFLTRDDQAFADTWMREERLGQTPFVVMAPVHRHAVRQWRGEGFRHVALQLVHKKNLRVYLAWGPSEKEIVEKIREGHEEAIGLLPSTRFREMGAIIKKAKFVVTNDSGAMHLSVSMGTPTVTIYGPTRPIDWNPSLSGGNNQEKHTAVTAPDVACLGCHYGACPVGHLCMKHLSADHVLAACEKYI